MESHAATPEFPETPYDRIHLGFLEHKGNPPPKLMLSSRSLTMQHMNFSSDFMEKDSGKVRIPLCIAGPMWVLVERFEDKNGVSEDTYSCLFQIPDPCRTKPTPKANKCGVCDAVIFMQDQCINYDHCREFFQDYPSVFVLAVLRELCLRISPKPILFSQRLMRILSKNDYIRDLTKPICIPKTVSRGPLRPDNVTPEEYSHALYHNFIIGLIHYELKDTIEARIGGFLLNNFLKIARIIVAQFTDKFEGIDLSKPYFLSNAGSEVAKNIVDNVISHISMVIGGMLTETLFYQGAEMVITKNILALNTPQLFDREKLLIDKLIHFTDLHLSYIPHVEHQALHGGPIFIDSEKLESLPQVSMSRDYTLETGNDYAQIPLCIAGPLFYLMARSYPALDYYSRHSFLEEISDKTQMSPYSYVEGCSATLTPRAERRTVSRYREMNTKGDDGCGDRPKM
ncbi:hypothetical protein Aperf_G00000124259 [Anoplocephala perfoliata]